MKLPRRAHVLTLVLCLLLAGFAGAQGRGKGGRGGKGKGGGQKSAQTAQTAQAKKAQQAASKQAKARQQQRTKQNKSWADAEKQKAQAREAQMKAKSKSAPEMATVFRTSCATCHVVPDPVFPADNQWLASLQTTHCRDLTPELRDGLTEFLRGAEQFRPHAITSHAEPAPGQSSVAANVEGEVFLRAESGAVFRLKWGPDQAGEKRVLPPGKYRLHGYRMVSGPLTLSTSGGQRTLVLRPDQNLTLRLEPELEVELTAASSRGQGQPNAMGLECTLRDAHGQAVSVYRGNTRIPIPFRVETDAGPTQQGVLAYTSEGRSEAIIEVPVGQASFARVDMPPLPFPVAGTPRIALPGQTPPQTPAQTSAARAGP